MTQPAAEHLFHGPLAEEYAMLKLICPPAAEMSRLVGEAVAEWRSPRPAERLEVLEIGTGTGITCTHLLAARDDLCIAGCDNSPVMLEQARRNLAEEIATGRLWLVERDALAELRGRPAESVDIVASGYAFHNFLDAYRTAVLRETFRVLKPGGLFVNGDRYARDDVAEQLPLIQEEVRGYFRILLELGRPDLLEQWIVHLFSDESPHHVMRLGPALQTMTEIGFVDVAVSYRDGVNALVRGVKPWA